MKKYWKNAKKTGKVREIRQSKKVGTMFIPKETNAKATSNYKKKVLSLLCSVNGSKILKGNFTKVARVLKVHFQYQSLSIMCSGFLSVPRFRM